MNKKHIIAGALAATLGASVLIPVSAVANEAGVVAHDDHYTVVAGESITLTPLANDEGTGLRLSGMTSQSELGDAKHKFNLGTHVFTPAPGFTGTAIYGYTVRDEEGNRASARIFIEVTSAAEEEPTQESSTEAQPVAPTQEAPAPTSTPVAPAQAEVAPAPVEAPEEEVVVAAPSAPVQRGDGFTQAPATSEQDKDVAVDTGAEQTVVNAQVEEPQTAPGVFAVGVTSGTSGSGGVGKTS